MAIHTLTCPQTGETFEARASRGDRFVTCPHCGEPHPFARAGPALPPDPGFIACADWIMSGFFVLSMIALPFAAWAQVAGWAHESTAEIFGPVFRTFAFSAVVVALAAIYRELRAIRIASDRNGEKDK